MFLFKIDGSANNNSADATLVAGAVTNMARNANAEGFMVATGTKKPFSSNITTQPRGLNNEDATLIGGVGASNVAPVSPAAQDDETAVPGRPLNINSNTAVPIMGQTGATSPNSITSVKLPISFLGGMGGAAGISAMAAASNPASSNNVPGGKLNMLNPRISIGGASGLPPLSSPIKPAAAANNNNGNNPLYEESSPTMDLEAIQKLLREDTSKL